MFAHCPVANRPALCLWPFFIHTHVHTHSGAERAHDEKTLSCFIVTQHLNHLSAETFTHVLIWLHLNLLGFWPHLMGLHILQWWLQVQITLDQFQSKNWRLLTSLNAHLLFFNYWYSCSSDQSCLKSALGGLTSCLLVSISVIDLHPLTHWLISLPEQ